jgi:hypothetical protein
MKKSLLLLFSLGISILKAQSFDYIYVPEINSYYAGNGMSYEFQGGDTSGAGIDDFITAGFGQPQNRSGGGPTEIKGEFIDVVETGGKQVITCNPQINTVCFTFGRTNYLDVGALIYLNDGVGSVFFAGDLQIGSSSLQMNEARKVGELGSSTAQNFFDTLLSLYPPGPGGQGMPGGIRGHLHSVDKFGDGVYIVDCIPDNAQICVKFVLPSP